MRQCRSYSEILNSFLDKIDAIIDCCEGQHEGLRREESNCDDTSLIFQRNTSKSLKSRFKPLIFLLTFFFDE